MNGMITAVKFIFYLITIPILLLYKLATDLIPSAIETLIIIIKELIK